jgi:hypothetical protein
MTVVDSVLLPPGIWWVNFTIKFNVQAQLSQSGSQAQPSVYCLYDNRVLTARSSGFTVVDTGGGLGTLPSLYYGDLHMTAQAVFELEEETRVKIECQSVGTDDDHGDVTYASSAVMALPLPGGVQYQWGSGENRQVPIYVDP